MFQNSHFALAVHILTALAIRTDEPVPSGDLAMSIGTNPAFLRGLLGRLKEAGLVEIKMGKGGGAQLRRKAEDISLVDVYRAVEHCQAITTHHSTPDTRCMVGRNILPVMEELIVDVQRAVENRLQAVNVADIAKKVRKLG